MSNLPNTRQKYVEQSQWCVLKVLNCTIYLSMVPTMKQLSDIGRCWFRFFLMKQNRWTVFVRFMGTSSLGRTIFLFLPVTGGQYRHPKLLTFYARKRKLHHLLKVMMWNWIGGKRGEYWRRKVGDWLSCENSKLYNTVRGTSLLRQYNYLNSQYNLNIRANTKKIVWQLLPKFL